jgi:8-oxo-dGTP diphosphatase
VEACGEQKVVAVALIRDDEGRIFVQQRMPGAFDAAAWKWEFPGGKIDFGERPEAAVVREAKEELGCDIEIIRLLPVVHSRVWHHRDGRLIQAFVLCYEARITAGIPRLEEDRTSQFRWCSETEILALDHLEGIPEFLTASNQRLT